MDISEYISVEEAAERSGYGKWNITLLCRQGKLEGAVKIGKVWLIPKKALEDYKPGPQGFAAVWAHRRAAQQEAQAEQPDAADRPSPEQESGQDSGQDSGQNDGDTEDVAREILRHLKILISKLDRLEKIGEKIIAGDTAKCNAQEKV
ncbi:MAG: helix-turn-helix domain-containing protein [Synergistaceae bacterium]|nr:helix-turn-helix domain-containing protein [Synergistaceae bacterium]